MADPARLDPIDRHLLALLQRNARLPVLALARAVGLSRSAVQDRLARLQRGVIDGFTIRLKAPVPAAGLRAFILLRIENRPCAKVLAAFRGWPEIRSCHFVAGPSDAVLDVAVADIAALNALRGRMAALPGVRTATAVPVMETLFEDRETAETTAP
ncbi:Lrp/AsnC family transcriptional regulator [Inquilinus sp.]|uniref:Lrp/AsnC family transcriptional regulator n=1 Tax=Inquilinus sp. TaxID=1932117 RepID=UPI0031D08825